MIRAFFILFCLVSTCFADNGHIVSTYKTENYNVAIFAEPWPLRVGEAQFRAIVTKHDGTLVTNPEILPFRGKVEIYKLPKQGTRMFYFNLDGIEQPPVVLEIHSKASILATYWQVWIFLFFGLLFIILREKLAKNQADRYPNR